MEDLINTLVIGLPSMFGHAAITTAMLIGAVWLSIKLTPYDDMELIKEGNVAAGISLFSIIVGLAIPLSFCLAQTSTIYELLFWSAFTVAIQLFAFKICDWMLSELPKRIEKGEVSAAIILLGVKLATAFINSAMG